MTILHQFEDIEAWRKARDLSKIIYQHTAGGKFRRDYSLKDQLRRSAVSVMSNIAEGFERGGNKEFIQFLSIAKGSAAEVESQLYIALDNDYISQAQFDEMTELTKSIKLLLSGFIRYLKNTDMKGSKYK